MSKKFQLYLGEIKRDIDVLRSGRYAARFSRWSGDGVLVTELFDLASISGLVAGLKAVNELFINLRFTDHEAIEDDKCGIWDRPRTYQVTVSVDGRNALDGTDDEIYWRTRKAGALALIHVAERFGASSAVVQQLKADYSSVPEGPDYPQTPAFDQEKFRRAYGAPVSIGEPEEVLQAAPGSLWVMLKHESADGEVGYEAIFQALKDFAHEQGLGEWEGDSQGAGEGDVSFYVHDQKRASELMLKFLAGAYEGIQVRIAEEFSPIGLLRHWKERHLRVKGFIAPCS